MMTDIPMPDANTLAGTAFFKQAIKMDLTAEEQAALDEHVAKNTSAPAAVADELIDSDADGIPDLTEPLPADFEPHDSDQVETDTGDETTDDLDDLAASEPEEN